MREVIQIGVMIGIGLLVFLLGFLLGVGSIARLMGLPEDNEE